MDAIKGRRPARAAALLGAVLSLAVLWACRAGDTARRARFSPAPTAEKKLMRSGAFQEQAGVKMTVDLGRWEGRPAELTRKVTPARVRIENDSGRPIRVRYREFALQSGEGREYRALSPYRMDETIRQAAFVDTEIDYDRYQLAPYYREYYDFGTGAEYWTGPFDYDAEYYDDYLVTWETELPTEDMMRKAMPEGVVNPGGSVEGFMYFENLPSGVSRVSYNAEIIDARSGERIGEIQIPFTRGE